MPLYTDPFHDEGAEEAPSQQDEWPHLPLSPGSGCTQSAASIVFEMEAEEMSAPVQRSYPPAPAVPPTADLPIAPHGWPTLREFPKWYWKRLTGWDQSLDVYFFRPHYEQLIGALMAFVIGMAVGCMEIYVYLPLVDGNLTIFIPALAASITCMVTMPKMPIAQPRNILLGHVAAGIIGISLMNIFLLRWPGNSYGIYLAGAIGVGLHQIVMIFTNTLHPPASATVVSAVHASYESFYNDKGFIYCVTPCITGPILIIILAILLNNLVPSRSPYPVYW